jgi:hypothetical protein
LFEGITYPNSIYLGNPFEPGQQFELDTILQDQPFYPTEVDVTSVLWNGTHYLASANLPDYSAVLGSASGDNWAIAKLTNVGVGATDIIYAGGYYVMTSTNSATPVFRSNDGITWTTNGYFTPWGSVPYDTIPYDMTSINIAALALNSVAYRNGYWVAVGDNIVRSDDTYIWREVNTFPAEYNNQLYGVDNVSLSSFSGFIAVGKGKRPDYSTGVTLLVDTNLILYSTDGLSWTNVPSLTPKGLHAIADNGSVAVAVGESGIVYYTNNGANWQGVNEVSIISINETTNQINVTNTAGFAVNDVVRFSAAIGGLSTTTSYYVVNVVSGSQIQVSATLGGSPVTLVNTSVPQQTMMYLYDATDPTPATLRDVTYANGVWIAVGDDGVIKTSSDYLTWTTVTSGTTENLNGINYNSDESSFIVVGDNNTILVSDDNGATWTSSSLFTVAPTVYDVKGADFPYGYGPEELVPGVVTDNLTMIVTTRPGTNWPVTEYSHTGYNVVSVEFTPTSAVQTEYSFSEVVQYPAQVSVQVLDATTGLGTTLPTSEYTVDWLNKAVVLNTPLDYLAPATQGLRIDVYEVGNGDQLVKSNSDTDPIRINLQSGYNEIYLNCNYSETIFQGSGVIRTGSHAIEVEAIATDGTNNRITCVSVSDFTVNDPISFQGVTFGNIQEEVTYYVKTVSVATNTITVSDSYNSITGTAGPTFSLATATGSMIVNIQTGTGTVWSDPIVYRNGTQLVLGKTNTISRTKASNNAITTNSTGGLIVGTPIIFDNSIFGGVIQPMTTYYIRSIIDGNEFTISATQGGPILTLPNATGGSRFVTNDYAFALQPNGQQAKMIFATDTYTNQTDYIVYSIFGETQPEQYGFTLPQVQEFNGDGSTSQFNLDNFVGDDNPENAIVEIDGIRQTISQYVINSSTNTITFDSPPANGSTISVTTYNDTARQYFITQYGITGTPGSAFITLTVGTTTNSIISYDELLGATTTVNAGSFVVGQAYTIVFLGTTNWNTVAGTTGHTYAVGDSFVAITTGSGTGTAFEATPTTIGSFDAESGNPFSPTSVTAGSFVTNVVYEITSLGTTNWNTVANTSGFTYSVGDIVVAKNPGTGTGTANTVISAFDQEYNWLTLSSGDTSSLNVNDSIVFSSPTIGGINAGQTYYVTEIWSSTEFVISETVGGSPVALTTDTGSMIASANGLTVAPIANINNNIQPPIASTFATGSTAGSPNEITVDSTDNFVVNQTVQFFGTSFDANIAVDGTVYFVDSIVSSTEFTIKDQDGNQIVTAGGTGNMLVQIGGTPTVTITTSIQHFFDENTLIRIDGVTGSTQLNNNTYYAKVIDDYTFQIYTQPYDPALYATNFPVTAVSAYTGGGYAWRAGLFYIVTTVASATTSSNDRITVSSVDKLVLGTPVEFTQVGSFAGDTIMGGLVQGQTYYIKEIFPTPINQFTVSATRNGDAVELTTYSGTDRMNVTQWEQINVNRLWVTVNGYRVPSSKLRVNSDNEVSILTEIAPGDEVIMTSMIPHSTPDEETYLNFVNQLNQATVYRANTETRTWLTQPVYELDTEIFVGDVRRLTDVVVQNVTAPSAVDGYYNIGLTADKRIIAGVQVLNNTTGNLISNSNFEVVIEELAPILKITAGAYITAGDSLTITTLEGNTLFVNGEQIKFGTIDFDANSLGQLQRGANGTAIQTVIPQYSEVYSLLSNNELPSAYYNQTWNSDVFNTTAGDPLQISDTVPAQFLHVDLT